MSVPQIVKASQLEEVDLETTKGLKPVNVVEAFSIGSLRELVGTAEVMD